MAKLLGRELERKALTAGIEAGLPVLLIGKPGVGKTHLVNETLRKYEGNKFTYHITKFTEEKEIFPIDLKTFQKEGRIRYLREGILNANFIYIDEIFDASDALLRAFLGIMNEKKFMKEEIIEVPLYCFIASSNYQRLNETTEAVLDRFVIKIQFKELNENQIRTLLEEYNLKDFQNDLETEKITLEELEQIRKEAESVFVPKDIIDLIVFSDASDRRKLQAKYLYQVMKLRGYTEKDMLMILAFTLDFKVEEIEKEILTKMRLNELKEIGNFLEELSVTYLTLLEPIELYNLLERLKECEIKLSQNYSTEFDQLIEELRDKITSYQNQIKDILIHKIPQFLTKKEEEKEEKKDEKETKKEEDNKGENPWE
ncbi:MAG: AAA family ATPase [Candidatus Helarchaeota archaeon]